MTSIKDALKAARRYISEESESESVWSTKMAAEALTAIEQALSQLTASPDREKVAALAHRFWSIHPSEIAAKNLTREEFYAREMMSLLSTIAPDEAAIRAAAFEEAAKIADARAAKLREKAKQQTKPGGNSYFHQAIEARVIASAIRSQNGGGK